MAYYKKMQPELMIIDFNSACIASVVNPDATTVKCQGNFVTVGDYIALIFNSIDSRMHDYCAYVTDYNFRDFKLSFQVAYTTGSADTIHYDDKTSKPVMVIKYIDDTEKYITMGFNTSKTTVTGESVGSFTTEIPLANGWVKWRSEVIHWVSGGLSGTGVRGTDYVIDYVNGTIAPVVGGSIPYAATITADYEYNDQTTYTFDFNALVQGEHPDSEVIVSNQKIKKILIPIMPTGFTLADYSCTGTYTPWCITFSNWTTENDYLNEVPPNKPLLPYDVAEGYDDEYVFNPKRLIESSYILGYRQAMNLYIGASHYYNRSGTLGLDGSDYSNLYLDTTDGLNLAFSEWLKYFCKTMKTLGYTDIVISVAMENLQMPEAWKQLLFDGTPGLTGWTPPTAFYSPCNADVKTYIIKVVNECMNIVTAESLNKLLQYGEPWWWTQSFAPGDVGTPNPDAPPAFYDDETKAAYLAEFGVAMPVWDNSNIEVTPEVETICEWLKDQLGAYSDFMELLAVVNSAKFGVLFFPPSVLDSDATPEIMQIANTPFTHWQYPDLEFFQTEDYDWLITQDPQHPESYEFAKDYLGFPYNKTHYFSGFAWSEYAPPISKQWELIEASAQYAVNKGFEYVFIWAGTQIRRDNWLPDSTFNAIKHLRFNSTIRDLSFFSQKRNLVFNSKIRNLNFMSGGD